MRYDENHLEDRVLRLRSLRGELSILFLSNMLAEFSLLGYNFHNCSLSLIVQLDDFF